MLPLLTGTFIVMPFMTYIADKVNCGYTGNYFEHYAIFFGKWTDLTGYDGGFSIGHLWFLLYLYIISIFSMIIIKMQKKHINSRNKKINIFFIILFLIISMLFMPVELGGKSILTYWLLFLFGYYIFSEEIHIENLKFLKYLYLIIFLVSIFLNIYLFLWSDLECDWINISVKYLSGAFGILTLIIFSKDFLNKYNKLTSFLIPCSFLIYIFHFIWVILFQYYLKIIIMNDLILFIISVIFSFITTVATCRIVKCIPVIRTLFGIK